MCGSEFDSTSTIRSVRGVARLAGKFERQELFHLETPEIELSVNVSPASIIDGTWWNGALSQRSSPRSPANGWTVACFRTVLACTSIMVPARH
jgi:hypothetical protein